MSKRDWTLLVNDIIDSITKIEGYIKELSYEDFIMDDKTKDAVVRNLEIIGEAAGKIPKEIREKYKDIPWAKIVGLRNRLIHGYFAIDYEIVWYIITTELPVLKSQMEEISKS